jgi:hypothetical protein
VNRQFHFGILNCGVPWNILNSFGVIVEFRLVKSPVMTFKFRWGDCGATGYGFNNAGNQVNAYANGNGIITCGMPACTFASVAGFDAATVRPCDLLSQLGASSSGPDCMMWHYANARQDTGLVDVVAAAITSPFSIVGEFDEIDIRMTEDIPTGRTTNSAAYNTLPAMATVLVAAVKSFSP